MEGWEGGAEQGGGEGVDLRSREMSSLAVVDGISQRVDHER